MKARSRSSINRHFRRESILMLLLPLVVLVLSLVLTTVVMWLD